MKKIVKVLQFILALLYFSASTAVEIQQGQIYSGGTYIESSFTGVGFTLPEPWKGIWPANSQMFIMEAQGIKANIFVYFDTGDINSLKNTLSANITLDQNIQLIPTGSVSHTENIYTAYYRLSNSNTIKGFISARVLPGKKVIAFISLAAENIAQKIEQQALTLAKSITITTPKNSSIANQQENSSDDESWAVFMKGKYLQRYFSGSNYHEHQQLWLCSDGRFLKKFSSGGSSLSGASGASANTWEGTWRVIDSADKTGELYLQFTNGGTSGYHLTFDKKIYLNGKKWLVAKKNTICQ